MDHFSPSLSGKRRVFLGRLQVGEHAFAITAVWVQSGLGSPKQLSRQSEAV